MNKRNYRFAGAANFRDLGGYTGLDGAKVRRHRIFRSDHLGALGADEASEIAALGLRRIVDLRGVTERSSAACVIEGVDIHSLPIEPTIVQAITDLLDTGHHLSPQEVVALMQDTYRGFVRRNTPRFAALFALLLQSDDPLVFHCTAGKDRTGFAAALILQSLGVSGADVMRDYLLTNERLKPDMSAWGRLAPEVAAVMYGVQPEFLDAAYGAVQEDFGGIEPYFREGLGLGEAQRERLRELYLEAASSQ
jgi:protein-tyrosine phosphatase